MKKILLVIPSFATGGTNASAINLLSMIDVNRYSFTVLAMSSQGHRKSEYQNCSFLEESLLLSALISSYKLEEKTHRKIVFGIIKMLRRFFKHLKIDITDIIFRYEAKRISANNTFDNVIAFLEGPTTLFVSYFPKVIKIAWIHCDYANYLKMNNIEPEASIYNNYDSIVCVSEYTKKSFASIIPSCKNKVEAINNIVNNERVIKLSKQSDILDTRFTTAEHTIISIGRIHPVKRFTAIPAIAAHLKKMNFPFKWYIIGSGSEDEQKRINDRILHYDVAEHVICLGFKDNPYIYLKECSLLVSTSFSEANPVTILEALILGVPVVSANFESSYEVIEDGVTGIITTIEKMEHSIALLFEDKEKYEKIKKNLIYYRYNNELILEKINCLLK